MLSAAETYRNVQNQLFLSITPQYVIVEIYKTSVQKNQTESNSFFVNIVA